MFEKCLFWIPYFIQNYSSRHSRKKIGNFCKIYAEPPSSASESVNSESSRSSRPPPSHKPFAFFLAGPASSSEVLLFCPESGGSVLLSAPDVDGARAKAASTASWTFSSVSLRSLSYTGSAKLSLSLFSPAASLRNFSSFCCFFSLASFSLSDLPATYFLSLSSLLTSLCLLPERSLEYQL